MNTGFHREAEGGIRTCVLLSFNTLFFIKVFCFQHPKLSTVLPLLLDSSFKILFFNVLGAKFINKINVL